MLIKNKNPNIFGTGGYRVKISPLMDDLQTPLDCAIKEIVNEMK